MSLWRNRDFMALWGGQVVSELGSRITTTAMPLLVLATTGSPGAAGLVAAAGSAPYLLLHLPAGTLVDRWPRRRIMLASQLTAAVALASVPFASRHIGYLAVVAFVEGTCFVFYGLAERASIPLIVPDALLPTALAQNEARSRGAFLVGPPLGGLLFAAGRAVPFVVDAVSYLAAAIGILFVRGDLQPRTAAVRSSLWRSTRAGLSWLWRQRFMRAVTVLVAASNLVFQALYLTLIVLARDRGASPAEIGVMLGVYGGGGLLGAIAATRLHRLLSPRSVVIGANWVWALLLPLLAIVPGVLSLGILGAVIIFVGPLWNVVVGAYSARLVPNELMGRVSSARMTLGYGAIPVGALLGGFLLETIGPTSTVLVLSGGMLLTAVAATVSPAMRHPPAGPADPADPPGPADPADPADPPGPADPA